MKINNFQTSINNASHLDQKQQKVKTGFESMLIREMVKEMTKDSGMLPTEGNTSVYEGFIVDALTTHLAESGLGISNSLFSESSSSSLQQPIHGTVTSEFGVRSDPFTHEHSIHKGIDIAAKEGSPFMTCKPGKVLQVSETDGYGLMAVIDHGNGLTSRYAHAKSFSIKPGQWVNAGQQIGLVGQTGRATGPHLHFEVRMHEKAIDPTPLMGQPNGFFTSNYSTFKK